MTSGVPVVTAPAEIDVATEERVPGWIWKPASASALGPGTPP
jgi:hypothetical protein